MTYSFIGLGKPIAAVNNLLKTHIKNFRLQNPGQIPLLPPGGIFASDYSMAAAFAGDNDMCAYMNIDDLLKNSDLVFVFLSDKALKSVSLNLGKHNPKGKIFCHFSPAYCADILDFNSNNTYVSMILPYITKDDEGHSFSNHIIAEGYGKQVDTLRDIFRIFQIDISFVTRDEKFIYLTGANMAKDMPIILKYASQRLIKYALASDADLAKELMDLAFEDAAQLNTYNAVTNSDVDFVYNQCEALKNLGIDDITNLYSSLLTICAEVEKTTDATQKIIKTAKRTMTEAL